MGCDQSSPRALRKALSAVNQKSEIKNLNSDERETISKVNYPKFHVNDSVKHNKLNHNLPSDTSRKRIKQSKQMPRFSIQIFNPKNQDGQELQSPIICDKQNLKVIPHKIVKKPQHFFIHSDERVKDQYHISTTGAVQQIPSVKRGEKQESFNVLSSLANNQKKSSKLEQKSKLVLTETNEQQSDNDNYTSKGRAVVSNKRASKNFLQILKQRSAIQNSH